MQFFKVSIVIFVLISIISNSIFAAEDWWRQFSCVTPKTTLKLQAAANESSEVIKVCSFGEEIRVVYGRKTLYFEGGFLKEQRWYEVEAYDCGQFVRGWAKVHEVIICNSK